MCQVVGTAFELAGVFYGTQAWHGYPAFICLDSLWKQFVALFDGSMLSPYPSYWVNENVILEWNAVITLVAPHDLPSLLHTCESIQNVATAAPESSSRHFY